MPGTPLAATLQGELPTLFYKAFVTFLCILETSTTFSQSLNSLGTCRLQQIVVATIHRDYCRPHCQNSKVNLSGSLPRVRSLAGESCIQEAWN